MACSCAASALSEVWHATGSLFRWLTRERLTIALFRSRIDAQLMALRFSNWKPTESTVPTCGKLREAADSVLTKSFERMEPIEPRPLVMIGSTVLRFFPSPRADDPQSRESGQVPPPWQPKTDPRDLDAGAAILERRRRSRVSMVLRAYKQLISSPNLGR